MSKSLTRVSHQKSLDNKDFVIQVTKAQLCKFFQIFGIIAVATFNILAVKISSPFLRELLFSQGIIALLFLIKKGNQKSKIK
jgi:hypothetical protein